MYHFGQLRYHNVRTSVLKYSRDPFQMKLILFVPVLVRRWLKRWRSRSATQRPSCPSSPSWASSGTANLWHPPTTPQTHSALSAPAACYRTLLTSSWFCTTAEEGTSDCSLWSMSSQWPSRVWMSGRSPCRSMKTSKDTTQTCSRAVTLRLCASCLKIVQRLKEQRGFIGFNMCSLHNEVSTVFQMTPYSF